MENAELQAIEDSKLLKRGTKVIHNGKKCTVLNFKMFESRGKKDD